MSERMLETRFGEMPEWSIGAVSKTVIPSGIQGSNPCLSAKARKPQTSAKAEVFLCNKVAVSSLTMPPCRIKKTLFAKRTEAFLLICKDARGSGGITSRRRRCSNPCFAAENGANN